MISMIWSICPGDSAEKTEEGEPFPSPAAMEYREFFREIFIDEYQDSNQVQELLLESISGESVGRYNRLW